MKRWIVIACIAGFAIAAVPLVTVAEPPRSAEDGLANVVLTLTIAEAEHGAPARRRSLRGLARDGSELQLKSGWRLPIAATTGDVAAGGGTTSVSYQEVGVSLRLELRTVGEKRIRARGEIEVSSVNPGKGANAAAGTPLIGTFSQRLDVVLRDGVDTTLAEVPKPDGGSLTLILSVAAQE